MFPAFVMRITFARLAGVVEDRAITLATHLFEIASNRSWQRHKTVLKARRREIGRLRATLDLIDQELKAALGEGEDA